jgi:hypothetical protein
MVFYPPVRSRISGDLGVEDEKAGLQFGDTRLNPFAMLPKQFAALVIGHAPLLPQRRITKHFTDRHSGGLETTDKFDPGQDGCIVTALARRIAESPGQQANPFIRLGWCAPISLCALRDRQSS